MKNYTSQHQPATMYGREKVRSKRLSRNRPLSSLWSANRKSGLSSSCVTEPPRHLWGQKEAWVRRKVDLKLPGSSKTRQSTLGSSKTHTIQRASCCMTLRPTVLGQALWRSGWIKHIPYWHQDKLWLLHFQFSSMTKTWWIEEEAV